jgi:hypothetical protein
MRTSRSAHRMDVIAFSLACCCCCFLSGQGGSHVCRFTSTGVLLRAIRLPVSKATSLCFGGPEFRDLYITSASKGVDRTKEPLAGSVFVVKQAGQGVEMNKLRGEFHQLRYAFAERWIGVVTQHQLIQRRMTPIVPLRAKL